MNCTLKLSSNACIFKITHGSPHTAYVPHRPQL